MAYAKRIDRNQPQIVSNLRRIGATVQILSMVGKGCPDILVGFKGTNYLFELKDGEKPKSKKQLTEDEKVFFDTWRGQVHKVESIDEILAVLDSNPQ